MGFVNREAMIKANIDRAEEELNEVLEQERPDELGAKLKEDKKTPPSESEIEEVIDGHNWKERYANLQRLRQKNLDDHKAQIADLNTKITDLTSKIENISRKAAPSELPESEEDVEALRTNNPAAYNAIVRLASDIADRKFEDRVKSISKDVDAIKLGHKKNAKEAAWIDLAKRHPDLDLQTLNKSDQFHEWLQSKSSRIQDIMYGDDMDVEAADDVLKLYKAAFPPATKNKTKKNNAEDINIKSAPSVPQKASGWDFTESQIEEMDFKNPKWIEENLEAIDKAQRSGRILYDKTDPVGSQRRIAAEAV